MDTYYIRIEPLPDSESTKPSREHRYYIYRVRIFKLLRSPENDSKESIPQAYVAWRAEPVFVNLLKSLGIDSQSGGPVRQPF
jgi:hypothetical protein